MVIFPVSYEPAVTVAVGAPDGTKSPMTGSSRTTIQIKTQTNRTIETARAAAVTQSLLPSEISGSTISVPHIRCEACRRDALATARFMLQPANTSLALMDYPSSQRRFSTIAQALWMTFSPSSIAFLMSSSDSAPGCSQK